ncbi:DNA-processing protein DprA [Fulvivirgaceae bacterium BMA12]|uniref:DNA-processing protein DprA n=1 Tax=Agaribacillus aureus TaxID=3051825 RepID=A0ABT8LA61_9BACT|nr:DNA-processing protein DprA [Fulvivirgaceae bacterium BMA12]
MPNEKICQIALTLIPGVGNILIKQLVSYCGSAEAVFKSKKHLLSKIPGIGIVHANTIRNANTFDQAEQTLKNAENKGIAVYFYTEKNYPHNLKQIYNAPSVVYVKGQADLNREKIVGIVGTRNATSYGKEITASIISGLRRHKPLIVSGLAYGIDIHAHRQALKANLPTLGIMASGLDIIYPSHHKSTVNEMITQQGGLLSEYAVGVKLDPHNFPARNRIIAGISDVLIIVEAARQGGALITANIADTYNKDIFAVPGNITNQYSEGCNLLIRHHKANIFTQIADLEKHMGWDMPNAPKTGSDRFKNHELRCTDEELKIVEIIKLKSAGMLIDEISFKTQLPINRIANLLLQMEFKGIVKALPGKKFILI